MKGSGPSASPIANRADSSGTRARLLDTAATLFYREGIRAVGVDLVVERSGVAKTSLYRYFPSKDDLIAAVLERDDQNYWVQWDRIAAKTSATPRESLSAQVQWIAQYIGRPQFRGCAFLNAATEFPAPDHPARRVALRHKAELRRRIGALTKGLDIRMPDELADQLVLLIDGAYINGQLRGRRGPVKNLVSAATALIEVATASRR